jgi:rhamnose transport system permease protein
MGSNSVSLPESFVGVDRTGTAGTNVPISLAGLVIVAFVLGVVLKRSSFGRWVYAVGGNEEAATYAGLPVARTKLLVFTLTGALCGLAALHLDSRLGVARHDLARGLELDAITAVVLGGASIFGGKGTVLGTMLAVALVAVFRIGMGLGNVKAEYQLAAVGALLILAVVLGNVRTAGLGRRRSEPSAVGPV